jgi:hypothetical protein
VISVLVLGIGRRPPWSPERGKQRRGKAPVGVGKLKRELVGWVLPVHLLCWRVCGSAFDDGRGHSHHRARTQNSLMFVAFQKAPLTRYIHRTGFRSSSRSRSRSSRMERFFGSFVPTTREVRFDCLPLPPSPIPLLPPLLTPHPLTSPPTVRDIQGRAV